MNRKALVAAAVVCTLIAAVIVATAGDDGGDGQESGNRAAPEQAEREGGGSGGDGNGAREGDGGGGEAEDADPVGDGTVSGRGGSRLIVGISDQKPALFDDPRLRRLGIEHVRLVVPWDAGLRGHAATDRWLDEARADGFTPLVAFVHADGSRCPDDPCEAPSEREFERAFEGFRERWPHVREFSTWNEPNHASQPLARRPELAATHWRTIRRHCRGCTVLAAGIVADRTAPRWVRGFLRAADRRPRVWGVHNYSDTNRFESVDTEAFLGLVEGRVWLTETGGIVKFTTTSGRTVFPYDERRAARATRQMFEVARSNPRIERLYVYHWNQDDPPGRFDAGLIGPDGEVRPAYRVLEREIAR